MKLHLLTADYLVLAAFAASVLLLGFSARLRDSSVFQFLMAGRSLSLPAFVATLVSTWYGGVLGIGQAVSTYGLGTWLLLGVPYYVFALVYAFWLAERVRGAKQFSIPERLEARFGKGTALMGALLVFLLAVPAAHVLMLGIVVQLASGWPLWSSVLVAALIGTLFLYKGGLLADVRVGFLAFLMMYVGFLAIDIYCLSHFSPAATLASIKPSELHKIDGGQGIVVVLSFLILGSWTLVDPGFHQRVSASSSPSKGKVGVLISVGFWALFDVMSITAGMYALGLMKSMPDDTLQIFPLFADQILPAGLKGLFLCGLIGTILSAFVGYTLISGASFGREIVGRVWPILGDSQVKSWTRAGLLVSCAVASVVALNIPSVVDLWYMWAGALVGTLLVPVALAYRGEVTERAPLKEDDAALRQGFWLTASMLIAFGFSIWWMIYARNHLISFFAGGDGIINDKRTANPYLEVVIGTERFSLGTLVPALAVSTAIIGLGKFVERINRDG